MRDHRRRIPLILGSALIATLMFFPATAAAAPVRVVPAAVLGDHVWTGELCDGTDVSVAYHVTARGRLVFDSVSGAPAREWGWRHAFFVRFVGAGTRVAVWVHWRNGRLHLHERVWQRPCEPAPEPPPVEEPPTGQLG